MQFGLATSIWSTTLLGGTCLRMMQVAPSALSPQLSRSGEIGLMHNCLAEYDHFGTPIICYFGFSSSSRLVWVMFYAECSVNLSLMYHFFRIQVRIQSAKYAWHWYLDLGLQFFWTDEEIVIIQELIQTPALCCTHCYIYVADNKTSIVADITSGNWRLAHMVAQYYISGLLYVVDANPPSVFLRLRWTYNSMHTRSTGGCTTCRRKYVYYT
jgi:hypothetical protein